MKAKQLEYKFYLDNDRFATVGFFNNELRVNIRQYEKSKYDTSKLFPTKTGISLLASEWQELVTHSEVICEELRKNILAEYHIGNEKYATISRYGDKGFVTISIRQHYTFDDGVRRPTKKGINLKKKEWNALVDIIELINEAIDNMKSEFMYDGKTIVKSVCVYFADKKCYQYGVVETGKVFYSPIESPIEAYKAFLKHGI